MWLSCRNWIYHCDCATSVLIPLSLILQMAFLHSQSFHRLFPTYLAVCTKQDQSSCLQSAHNAGLHHLLITFSITLFCSFLSGNPSLLEESHHQPPPRQCQYQPWSPYFLLRCLMMMIRSMEGACHSHHLHLIVLVTYILFLIFIYTFLSPFKLLFRNMPFPTSVNHLSFILDYCHLSVYRLLS